MRATSPKIRYEVDLLKRQSHWRKGVFSKGAVCEKQVYISACLSNRFPNLSNRCWF